MTFRRKLSNVSAWALAMATILLLVLLPISTVHRVSLRYAWSEHSVGVAVSDACLAIGLDTIESVGPGRSSFITGWKTESYDHSFSIRFRPTTWTFGNINGRSAVRTRSAYIPAWIILPLLAAWPIFVIRRHRCHPPAGHCTRCGYNLRGTVDAGGEACPECGEPIAATAPPAASQATTS